MRPPLIGITTTGRHEDLVASAWYDEIFAVPAPYVDAVRRAGGVPILLPPGGDDAPQWLAAVDGLIVTGGADVGAVHYSGDPSHPEQQKPQPERDETELGLARQLVQDDLPVLFVCRGMQVLNVALGGTLHQHLADEIEEDIHKLEGEGWAYHDVEIKPGSWTAKATGDDSVAGATGHHQAIDRLAPGLEAVAWAADGVIEAIEVPGAAWLVAVQWHPEVTAATDGAQQGLFDDLVAAAADRGGRERDKAPLVEQD